MNQEQSIALWRHGKEAWNAWAKEMLCTREELKASGAWVEEKDEAGRLHALSNEARIWLDNAKVDFSACNFVAESRQVLSAHAGDAVNFTEIVFPDVALFDGTTFVGASKFNRATFNGRVSFRNCTFTDHTLFLNATFGDAAEFQETRFGYAHFLYTSFAKGPKFDKVEFEGDAIFSGITFPEEAIFLETIFRDAATFRNVNFLGRAYFLHAKFMKYCYFENADFDGIAVFAEASFRKDCRFQKAEFKGLATFERAQLEGSVIFAGTKFNGSTFFRDVQFGSTTKPQDADFTAIKADQAFDLSGAVFSKAPSFNQADFKQAPDLDNVDFPLPGRWKRGDKDLISRYRHIRRLAIQGHNYEREQMAFKGELRSRRGHLDYRYGLGFWYDLIADCGRSIWRPFFTWAGLILAFAAFYFWRAVDGIAARCANVDSPALQALYLSIKNALVLFGGTRDARVNQAYLCLYGNGGEVNQPAIPTSVTFVEMLAQTPISAMLIFLFLLAVRNQFKIK